MQIFRNQLIPMRTSSLLLLLVILIWGCNKEKLSLDRNSQGEIECLKPLWKNKYIENQNWLDAPPGIFGNWSFGNRVLMEYRGSDNSIVLRCIDPVDGAISWEWRDWFHSETEQTNGRYYFLKDNVLHWKSGDRQYWLNLQSGKTIKRHNVMQNFGYIMEHLSDKYFVIGKDWELYPGLGIGCVYQGNFYDENPEQVLVPEVNLDQTQGYRASDITSIIPYVQGSDTLLIVAWQQVFPEYNFQSYLGLYNLSLKTWVYNNVPLYKVDRKGVLYQPLKRYKNTVITNVGKSLVCFDFLKGEKVWEQEFDHDFSFSGFEISDDILVANCEDKNLYGINPQSGDILWRGEGAGTSSKLQNRILNGVVYFSGGSSGYFHAVDISTGETLWKLDPYLYEESNAYWSTADVHVSKPTTSENGYIIINNALNSYCFPAAK